MATTEDDFNLTDAIRIRANLEAAAGNEGGFAMARRDSWGLKLPAPAPKPLRWRREKPRSDSGQVRRLVLEVNVECPTSEDFLGAVADRVAEVLDRLPPVGAWDRVTARFEDKPGLLGRLTGKGK